MILHHGIALQHWIAHKSMKIKIQYPVYIPGIYQVYTATRKIHGIYVVYTYYIPCRGSRWSYCTEKIVTDTMWQRINFCRYLTRYVREAPCRPQSSSTTVHLLTLILGRHLLKPLYCWKNQLELALTYQSWEESAPNMVLWSGVHMEPFSMWHDRRAVSSPSFIVYHRTNPMPTNWQTTHDIHLSILGKLPECIILYALNFWVLECTANPGRSFPHWQAPMLWIGMYRIGFLWSSSYATREPIDPNQTK